MSSGEPGLDVGSLFRTHLLGRGPEVLAVGYDEILALNQEMSPEERAHIQTWLP